VAAAAGAAAGAAAEAAAAGAGAAAAAAAELPPPGVNAVDCAEFYGSINSFSIFRPAERPKQAAIFVTRVISRDARAFWYRRGTGDKRHCSVDRLSTGGF